MGNMKKSLTMIAGSLLFSALVVGCSGTSSPIVSTAPTTVATAPTTINPTSAPSHSVDVPTEVDATIAPTPTTVTTSPASNTTQSVLSTLEVKGKAPKTGYNRDLFGKAWADVDKNDCDTRNDILNRDLTDIYKDSGCKVKTGKLADTYTATNIDFVRGNGALIDIDHIVALGNVWITGGQQLTDAQRLYIANDSLNLRAVQASANRQKGDSDAASWLPSNKSVRCDYVAHQIAVKAKYKLWVTQAEKEAMDVILAGCPDFPLPVDGSLTASNANDSQAPVKPVESSVAPVPAPAAGVTVEGVDPRFASCKQAKANGFGPYTKYQIEYGYYTDADKDGIVCE